MDLENCPELRRRVTAAKQATLISVGREDAIPAAVLKIVKEVGKRPSEPHISIRSVGVIVNRVRTAREVHQTLISAGLSAHLITGRMRPLDRVDALERIGPVSTPTVTNQTTPSRSWFRHKPSKSEPTSALRSSSPSVHR